jgi:hypothetical protein
MLVTSLSGKSVKVWGCLEPEVNPAINGDKEQSYRSHAAMKNLSDMREATGVVEDVPRRSLLGRAPEFLTRPVAWEWREV